MTSQLPLFLQSDASDDSSVDNSTTFVPNQKLAVHRWFRYSAGFSAEWARSEIERHCNDGEGVVFDPFAGSATTLLAAQRLGVDSIGLEPHPFVYRVAEAKLDWTNPHDAFREATQKLSLIHI